MVYVKEKRGEMTLIPKDKRWLLRILFYDKNEVDHKIALGLGGGF